ncbi:WG repeat-containing protein [Mesonia maritima]|uniref:WG repeat protein n=1 Tax=Mesonia maritima TaxID=1793873 RepID=A0ABU1K5Q6_9FLAO|nr:WG repeat-containing protein [Mesonia maritima]MDR6300950.1 hypothetical protein [Mesonia maritima]
MSTYNTNIHRLLLLSLICFFNACDTSKNVAEKNSDAATQAVIDTVIYPKSTPFFQGIARVEKDSSHFYITKNGRRAFTSIVQDFHPLDSVVPTSNGMERSYENENKLMYIVQVANGKSGMLNETGEWVIPPKYEKISFVFGRYLQIEDQGKKTFADSWGQFLVPLEFEDVMVLNRHLFDVKKNGKWGVYDAETEKIKIPFEYDQFDYCSGCGRKSDYLYAKKDGKWGVINFKNEVLAPFHYEHQHVNMRSDEWVAAFRKNGEQVVFNLPKQKEFAGPEYKRLQIENGHLIASKAGKSPNAEALFGLINRNGEQIVPFEYSAIYNPYSTFQSGAYFSVEKDGNYGIIDTLGNVIIPPTYKNRLMVRGDYFISKKDDKLGLLDKQNKQLLPNTYDWIDLSEIRTGPDQLMPIFKIRTNGKYGFYVPKTGKIVPPQYDRVEFFNDRQSYRFEEKPVGLIRLEKDGKDQLYLLHSDKIIPGDYAKIELQAHHKVILSQENYGAQGVYDLAKEQLIIPIEYNYIRMFNQKHQLIRVEKETENHRTLAGLFDAEGNEVLPFSYTHIEQMDDPYFVLKHNENGYALFNAETNTQEPLPFTEMSKDENHWLLTVQKNGKTYLYDYKKQKLLTEGYSLIKPLKNGNYLVAQQEANRLNFGYANAEGKLIVPVTYDSQEDDYLQKFENEHYLPLFKKDPATGKMWKGFANLEGKIVVPARFQKVFEEENGNGFLTMLDHRFGIITAEGKELLPPKYDIYLNQRLNVYRETSNFSFPIAFKKDGLWQFMDKNGQLLPIKTREMIDVPQY